MKHWFIDLDNNPLPSWIQAFPEALVCARSNLPLMQADEQGVLWCRVRSGESIAAVLSPIVHYPAQSVVLLCDEPDDALVMQGMAAGAAGCCNTHAAPEVLSQIALVVGHGGLWIGQSLLQRLVGSTAHALGQRPVQPKHEDWAGLLSDRETQVARLVANGASNKEIARQLEITERTVKAHLTAVFEKLGLRDRLQLSLKINGLSI